mmetsp:Transcript_36835/g.50744  ORF Transcript_36835/g.50744 Transcript_36835/m.50744 type:complete len:421 (+) Transcript_36835:89-1351(+)|eukprot:CAMPEP_0201492344 /NCGR_PEP_ID=MMETSP0151_2-20130828/32721_1 /ASSEMBLY_ACC=CAM_ASM_000257 /TAXON_ID=200890 /ORGANISM="Paramoeba atlantica, Strain 621/1 / CCAP 1560/9" /LENGTH=420 /DNA_ID=CAMNT_0047879099 /DNA_START=72 /DNA_END=1334 /DNA_ORIENTATION=-
MASKKAIDYVSYLSKRGLRYQPSAIRALAPLLQVDGMISLAGGLPNPDLFPISKMSLELTGGQKVEIPKKRLQEGLQYSASYGLPDLLAWLKDFQNDAHSPSRDWHNWGVCVFNGSQDAIYKSMDMLLDSGDHLLVEEPSYSGTLAALRPLHCNLVGVKTDSNGLLPDELERILKTWPKEQYSSRPKILYTIPTGQNPSGSTMTIERRKKVLEIAQNYSLLILEDDPYYHVHFDNKNKPPSLFNLDKEGRVLRFDSFSKILSSGLRLGWATGPNFLVDRLQLMQQASTMHPSGISQILALTVLEQLGKEGFDNHLKIVQETYLKRRNLFLTYVEKHLKGLVEYGVPDAGMFVWFKLKGVEDSMELIQKEALEAKVLLVPGASFFCDESPSPYVRASFSTASEDEMDIALERFASILREIQ